MAITLTFNDIVDKYNKVSNYWEDVDEFEHFYLRYMRETRPDRIYYTGPLETEIYFEPVDHFPKLKLYEVWCEGYRATGESGQAMLMGSANARNFRQACNVVMCAHYMQFVERVNSQDYVENGTQGRWDYDPSALTYWGCALSWNEKIARKVFG